MKILQYLILTLFMFSCAGYQEIPPQAPEAPEVTEQVPEEETVRKPKRISNFKYDESIKEEIKKFSRPGGPAKNLRLDHKTIKLEKFVSGFYLNREFRPAWLNQNGFANRNSQEIIVSVYDSSIEGLDPENYFIEEIYYMLDKIESQEYSSRDDLAKFDILLTNSYFKLADHILHGDPQIRTYKFDASYVEPFVNMTRLLESGVEDKKVSKSLDKLRPKTPFYRMFTKALQEYTEISTRGGWPTIPSGKDLKKGTVDRRVSLLRKRLEITGDIGNRGFKRSGFMNDTKVNFDKLQNDPDYVPPIATFDKSIDLGVRNFQRRHNLIPDGIVGGTTLGALNISAERKVEFIKSNLNVLRKLPRNLGDRYVLVNIPFYTLYAFENEKPVLDMKVIVGTREWSTPLFSDEISYLVVNPFWNIPDSILTKEFLPNLKEDPNFLKDSDIKVVGAEETFGTDEYDWENFDSEDWVYKLRQDPGPSNPLGRIKFMFPNKYNVYLHDTPHKKFFDRTQRSFSHGCVRVEKPMELVDFVLKDDSKLKREDIINYIESNKVRRLDLEKRVPVHLLYFTVWMDENETIYFPLDIYNKLG